MDPTINVGSTEPTITVGESVLKGNSPFPASVRREEIHLLTLPPSLLGKRKRQAVMVPAAHTHTHTQTYICAHKQPTNVYTHPHTKTNVTID